MVTGAGRGIGRAHALLLAREGASVVVNDLGKRLDGVGDSSTPAEAVAEEIALFGGAAVVSTHDVSDWDQGEALVDLAIRSWGRSTAIPSCGASRPRRSWCPTSWSLSSSREAGTWSPISSIVLLGMSRSASRSRWPLSTSLVIEPCPCSGRAGPNRRSLCPAGDRRDRNRTGRVTRRSFSV